MIVVLEGKVGSGKTLAAVALATLENQKSGKRILSNIRLNEIPYQLFDTNDLLRMMSNSDELSDCSIILDDGCHVAVQMCVASGSFRRCLMAAIIVSRYLLSPISALIVSRACLASGQIFSTPPFLQLVTRCCIESTCPQSRHWLVMAGCLPLSYLKMFHC